MNSLSDSDIWFVLSLSKAISTKQLLLFVESGNSIQTLMNFSPEEIKRCGLLTRNGIYEGTKELIKESEKVRRQCENLAIEIVTFVDKSFPSMLRHIYNPPLVLYIRGKSLKERKISLADIAKKTIAVVGTRKSELYINQLTHRFATELGKAGFYVASGMAGGVDRFAHLGALAQGSQTIAVLAGGADHIYPYANRDIYKQICEGGGVVVAEHPPGVHPKPFHFPKRNRIISGLSSAVFLPQAPSKSGAMITAMHAVEQGKTVYALLVPEDTGEHFAGNRYLQNAGAIMVSNPNQLLDDFTKVQEKLPGNLIDEDDEVQMDKVLEEVEEVLVFLQAFPRTIEEIATVTSKTVSDASAMIMEMRLSGLVKELPGNRFCAV